MKYQKSFINILFVFFLFFTVSVQAESESEKQLREINELEKHVRERGVHVDDHLLFLIGEKRYEILTKQAEEFHKSSSVIREEEYQKWIKQVEEFHKSHKNEGFSLSSSYLQALYKVKKELRDIGLEDVYRGLDFIAPINSGAETIESSKIKTVLKDAIKSSKSLAVMEYAGKGANILDMVINMKNTAKTAFDHDFYGTIKAIFNADVQSKLSAAAATATVGAVGSNPLGIAAGIGAGTLTAIGFDVLDPFERTFGAIGRTFGPTYRFSQIYYRFLQAYYSAKESFHYCNIANAYNAINKGNKSLKNELEKATKKHKVSMRDLNDFKERYQYKLLDKVAEIKMNKKSGKVYDDNRTIIWIEGWLNELTNLEKVINKKDKLFDPFREKYTKYMHSVKNISSAYEACSNYKLLVAEITQEDLCLRIFFETTPSLRGEKNKLMIEMNNRNHHMSSDRLNTLDNFRKPASCSSLDNDLEKLLDFEKETLQKPIYTFTDSFCTPQDQSNFFSEVKAVISEIVEKKRKCKEEKKAAEDKKKAEEEEAANKAIAEKKKAEEEEAEEDKKKAEDDNKTEEENCLGPVFVWDNVKQRCITQDEVNCLGPVFVWDNVKQRCITQDEANCLGPEFVWDKVKKKCVAQDEAKQEVAMAQSDYPIVRTFPLGATQNELSTFCDKILHGSIAEGGECVCPKGREKSLKLGICVEKTDANKTTLEDKVLNQIIYRIEGYGFIPHWGSGSFISLGYRDKLVTLKEPATEEYIQSILDKVRDGFNVDICNSSIPANPLGSRPPAIWKVFNVVVIRGPVSDLSNVKLENTWKIEGRDGPSVSELKKGTGCTYD